jgi:single-strand DNA-binding protein
MAGINKVILVGNIGRDPQTFEFEGGNKKISFSLATTESYRDRDGNWQDQTEWHNIVGYRYLADKNFAKGDMVYVEGKLKTRKYTDKDGVDKYITEIVADKINILVRRNQEGYQGSQTSYNAPAQETTNETPQSPQPPDAEDLNSQTDDLPF